MMEDYFALPTEVLRKDERPEFGYQVVSVCYGSEGLGTRSPSVWENNQDLHTKRLEIRCAPRQLHLPSSDVYHQVQVSPLSPGRNDTCYEGRLT